MQKCITIYKYYFRLRCALQVIIEWEVSDLEGPYPPAPILLGYIGH